MVQFIPSAPGTTPWAPQRPSPLEQIGPALGQIGQMMGAPDANGNVQGIAAILQALHGQKTLNDLIGMHKPAPVVGPQGYVPPGAGPNAVPAGATPPAPKSPFGPLGDIPMNKMKQINEITGKTGISGILNNANSMTLYMSPDGSLSMNPSPGAVPIGGYKGPQAAEAVGKSNHLAFQEKLAAMKVPKDPVMKQKYDTARIYATVLGNPMVQLPDAVQQEFTTQLASLMQELNGGKGSGDGQPKKRVKVKGPNNQTGTIEEGDALPAGWSLGGK